MAVAALAVLIVWMAIPLHERERVDYIAHAGGSIEGYTYTNCLEAVERSVREGYTYIELDICLTADSVPVAVHDWDTWREMAGMSDALPDVPTLGQFKASRLYGKYTPISYRDIDSIWKANPGLVFVVDKFDNAVILERFFRDLKERMIVECFSANALDDLRDCGFKAMYNYRNPCNSLKMECRCGGNAGTVTLGTDIYDGRFKLLNRIVKRQLALYFIRDSLEA